MALGAQSAVDQDGVSNLLRGARFELMPFDSFNDELESLPAGSSIAITTSPQLGIEQTVERAEEAAAQGYEVVPHIAARYVEDEAQLASIAERLSDAGVNDVFIPGGDREEPAGEFTSAYDLLEVLDELPYSFEDIGITGYPEGHDFIEDEELAMAMDQKAPHATYIVTQLCYDPETILEWVESTRERGVDLPIEIGIPGVMNYQKLLQISQKVGVGDSIRFLRKTTGVFEFVRQLIGSRGVYEPDDLINGLSPYVEDEYYNIRGVHIYTFNQTPDLESWRQTRLA
ncbi:methylenetetrahydrofolate reductase [Haloquadratum walsbyi]|jgi:methylenetetrahydrofolate reductase (NADPH)|uniref:Homolog to 5,10-methylenetetrahydrofolate reductase n=2 Tax=Haloquadratum walsbyi TaxID=293091 RepID=Q18JC7_HALWD|nr:methylenetetrahydrofolate reductase [Haloquadratum walsbyi]CAJ51884.1 homolog to 5,10-methylenetetrahydrofolate reductase [Haloquadratum walsbyi DSM 16790]CCC39803.1 homolog to 5,10-methylenetetrahydrofolate reductase [Haloquadratum walsbyi C23]